MHRHLVRYIKKLESSSLVISNGDPEAFPQVVQEDIIRCLPCRHFALTSTKPSTIAIIPSSVHPNRILVALYLKSLPISAGPLDSWLFCPGDVPSESISTRNLFCSQRGSIATLIFLPRARLGLLARREISGVWVILTWIPLLQSYLLMKFQCF